MGKNSRNRLNDRQPLFWQLLSIVNDPINGWSVLNAYNDLAKNQWLDRTALQRLQETKLRNLAAVVRENVQYYKNLLPEHVVGMDRLSELPILRKTDIRSAGSRITNQAYRSYQLEYSSTGGTTGEPLKVVKNKSTVAVSSAAVLRAKSWAGIKMGDRGVLLKGVGKISLAGRVRQRFLNTCAIEAFETGDKQFLHRTDTIRKLRPNYIAGYPTELLNLSSQVNREALKIPVVFSTGEMLHSHQRKTLSKTFGSHVSDYYGSNEINSIAFECEAGNKHVVDEHVILETVDDSNTPVWETPGRILVTDLDNDAMPFIRYEIGDVGVLTRTPCECGRAHTVLKEIQGRTQEMLRVKDGRALPAIFFAARFRGLSAVHKYQIEQTAWDHVALRYVPVNASAQSEIEAICNEIRSRLGPDIKVTTIKTDTIPTTARGKSRLVIGLKS